MDGPPWQSVRRVASAALTGVGDAGRRAGIGIGRAGVKELSGDDGDFEPTERVADGTGPACLDPACERVASCPSACGSARRCPLLCGRRAPPDRRVPAGGRSVLPRGVAVQGQRVRAALLAGCPIPGPARLGPDPVPGCAVPLGGGGHRVGREIPAWAGLPACDCLPDVAAPRLQQRAGTDPCRAQSYCALVRRTAHTARAPRGGWGQSGSGKRAPVRRRPRASDHGAAGMVRRPLAPFGHARLDAPAARRAGDCRNGPRIRRRGFRKSRDGRRRLARSDPEGEPLHPAKRVGRGLPGAHRRAGPGARRGGPKPGRQARGAVLLDRRGGGRRRGSCPGRRVPPRRDDPSGAALADPVVGLLGRSVRRGGGCAAAVGFRQRMCPDVRLGRPGSRAVLLPVPSRGTVAAGCARDHAGALRKARRGREVLGVRRPGVAGGACRRRGDRARRGRVCLRFLSGRARGRDGRHGAGFRRAILRVDRGAGIAGACRQPAGPQAVAPNLVAACDRPCLCVDLSRGRSKRGDARERGADRLGLARGPGGDRRCGHGLLAREHRPRLVRAAPPRLRFQRADGGTDVRSGPLCRGTPSHRPARFPGGLDGLLDFRAARRRDVPSPRPDDEALRRICADRRTLAVVLDFPLGAPGFARRASLGDGNSVWVHRCAELPASGLAVR